MIIVYPESAPEHWENVLEELHIEWCCSPLHNSDTLPTGEHKKDHWHVIVTFEGVKSYEQVKEISDALNAPIPKRCESLRGAVRYLAHLDSPDKAAYDKAEIRCFGGMEVDEYLRCSEQGRQNVVRDMCRWCMENHVKEFWELMQYAMDNEPDWWESLTANSAYLMDKFIGSRRNWYKEVGENDDNGHSSCSRDPARRD